MMYEVFGQGDKDLPHHRSGRIENRKRCENLLAAKGQKVDSLLANKRQFLDSSDRPHADIAASLDIY